jgi:hypothetical protein
VSAQLSFSFFNLFLRSDFFEKGIVYVRDCDNASWVIQKLPTCPDREATHAVKWSCCNRKSAFNLFLVIPEVNVYCAWRIILCVCV